MVAPTFVYGAVAARLTLLVVAAVMLVMSAYLFFSGEWSARFAGAVVALTVPAFTVAWALGHRGGDAELIKDVACLVFLYGLTLGLPRVISTDTKFKERFAQRLSSLIREQRK